jgi:hypothetical protein
MGAAGLLLLGAAATACSDDGGDEAALEEAVRTYTEAYFAPDAETAYGMLTTRCQGTIAQETFTEVVEQGAAEYDALTVEAFSVDEIDGDSARVTYSVGLDALDSGLTEQRWTREDGEWRFDAC